MSAPPARERLPPEKLPAPLQVITRDYRPPGEPPRRERIRFLQWNIERGYKLPGIIEELRRCDADVIALQEVDIGCERSGCADCGEEIARALGMSYAFVAEFEELHSPLRRADTQGGGVHGQALLSRYSLEEVRALVHSHQPVDWDAEGEARREPRKGKRVALAAVVALPPPLARVLLYSLHLEVFTGITGRLMQFADVLQDACRPGQPARQVVMGDLNTMAHSVARLSPTYCCDKFRWASLGSSEARFWQTNLFDVMAEQAEGEAEEAVPADAAVPAPLAATSSSSSVLRVASGAANPRLAAWGLPPALCAAAVNPGFRDPFCPDADVTLNNPTYWGLMQGRLDWLLLRGPGMAAAAKALGNHEYALSDHKWLSVDVSLRC